MNKVLQPLVSENEKSVKWKCASSPSGAHHQVEKNKSDGVGLFECKYCSRTKKLPTDCEAGGYYVVNDSPDSITRGAILAQ